MVFAEPLASRSFAAVFEPFARLANAKGLGGIAIRAPGDGSIIASAVGRAMVMVRASADATRVANSTGLARLQVQAHSDGTRVATGVGVAAMRSVAKGWSAQVNFPSYPPEFGRLVHIGKRLYRWEQTLGRWTPAGPA